MRVALVHDFLLRMGGAERVLKVLADMYPKAPIYTLLYDEKSAGNVFPKERVRVSRLQDFPFFLKNRHRYLLPVFPRVVEEWDFSGFDLVISSSSAFSHGIVTPLHTQHIAYLHSPMRFAWDWYHEYLEEQNVGFFRKAAIALLMKRIRQWDKLASDRPDYFITNSKTVQKRVAKYYRSESMVVYPPVDTTRFKLQKENNDYFLIVSPLRPYKKIELAIDLFNKIKKRLVIIGEGSYRKFLESIAGDTVDFLGFKPDEVVAEYMQNCRALIFPGEDDFGITPVEAMACGKPVLAFARGGATETVIPGYTGELFTEPTTDSMEQGLARLLLHEKQYHPYGIRRHAERFNTEAFQSSMRRFVAKARKEAGKQEEKSLLV